VIARLLAALALIAALAAGHPAQAEQLVLSISRHQVLVNSSFTGTSIVLFGTVEPDKPGARQTPRPYDIVVTIRGPRQNVVTRHKERVLGIFTNVGGREFIGVPSYLASMANRPFEEIADANAQRRLQIGFDNILLPQRIGPDVADTVRTDPFRTNFIRLKSEQGLYTQQANGVTMLTPTVFRAGIPIPAIAPVGSYEVDVKLLSGGALLARHTSAFELVKVGFEQFVVTAAKQYGLLYGIAAVMMALLTGWLASVVFRRD
jgi:uncharacterized protein (TIGR02186 family)